MTIINKNAKAISGAVESGGDPFAVRLDDTQSAVKSKGIHGCCVTSPLHTTQHLFLRFACFCVAYIVLFLFFVLFPG